MRSIIIFVLVASKKMVSKMKKVERMNQIFSAVNEDTGIYFGEYMGELVPVYLRKKD